MVAKGTYADLQRSGVDFTSLLKEDEEQQQPQDVPTRNRTLSQNSTLSHTSSVHSVKDGDHLPVCTPSFLNVTGALVSRPRRFLVYFSLWWSEQEAELQLSPGSDSVMPET